MTNYHTSYIARKRRRINDICAKMRAGKERKRMEQDYAPHPGRPKLCMQVVVKEFESAEPKATTYHLQACNARREVWIADKFGRCKVCSDAVKGLSMGTTQYIDALIAVKARLTDPKNKRFSATKKVKTKIKAALAILPRPRFKSSLDVPVRAHRKRDGSNPRKPASRKSSLDMTISEVARTGKTHIIDMMQAERALHLSEADKLGKAISLLGGL